MELFYVRQFRIILFPFIKNELYKWGSGEWGVKIFEIVLPFNLTSLIEESGKRATFWKDLQLDIRLGDDITFIKVRTFDPIVRK